MKLFAEGKLRQVTFKYGFPQYAKPAAAASRAARIQGWQGTRDGGPHQG